MEDRNKDINGKESSKRYWANKFLAVALLMAVIYFLIMMGFALVNRVFDIKFPFEMWYGLVGGGFGSLGLTIFESKLK